MSKACGHGPANHSGLTESEHGSLRSSRRQFCVGELERKIAYAHFPPDEIRKAYENFEAVSDRCASTADYNAFADLFTEDCTYNEHAFGDMHGREEVRNWIVPLMKDYPINQMERYTHDWVLFDEKNARVVLCARTHMADPGDGSAHSSTNWTMIDYAGDGLWSREEDIYNPAKFGEMIGGMGSSPGQ